MKINIERNIKEIAFKIDRLFDKKIYGADFQHIYCDLQILLGESFKAIIIIIIGFVLKVPLECFIILINFVLLRYLSGGYHADTYNKCFVQTLVTYTTGMLLCKLLHYLNNTHIVNILFLITALIVIIYAPKFSSKVPKIVEMKYKVLSIVLVIVAFCFYRYNIQILNFINTHIVNITNAIVLGLLLQSVTLTKKFNRLLGGKHK